MTRYYFDTFDGNAKINDCEGVECASRAAARDEAASALADMARDVLPAGAKRKFMVQIRDEDGKWFEGTLEYIGRDTRV